MNGTDARCLIAETEDLLSAIEQLRHGDAIAQNSALDLVRFVSERVEVLRYLAEGWNVAELHAVIQQSKTVRQ